jgi:hypothetical protein
MSCCGGKRAAYRQELQNQAAPGYGYAAKKKPRVFEYTGSGSLKLQGASSGTVYHFRSHGEKIEVDYDDSFAMMAERDLRIIIS